MTAWTPPYKAPDGWSWRGQDGRHYLAHERAQIGEGARIGEMAKIGKGARGYLSGLMLGYRWSAHRDHDGVIWLHYGYESLPISEWPTKLVGLCAEHEPTRAAEYERAIGALVSVMEQLIESTEVTP